MTAQLQRSVVIVQYAGDYGEAFQRLEGGGAENYYAQRYSLDVVASLVSADTTVAVICCTATQDEDRLLANGVRVINLHSPVAVDPDRVWSAVKACEPSHVCMRTPIAAVLRAALGCASVKSVLLTLADSFEDRSLRGRLRAWRLRRLLNHPKVIAVGNHGVNASESLRRIGVRASKIVPWDWPHDVTPHRAAAKTAPVATQWTLFFVGLIIESKGIGDVMQAVRLLQDDGILVNLSCAGRGETDKFMALAAQLGISAQVRFLGMIPHSQVVPNMRAADLVVIPSRHEYPEGFPMTVYEALSSRTPIVASDHPMYAPHLLKTGSATVFAASDPNAMARCIKAVMGAPEVYAALSSASAGAWDKLQLPITWGDLLTAWIDRGPDEPYAPLKHALASMH